MNNLALALIRRQGFRFVPAARRFLALPDCCRAAHPLDAFQLIMLQARLMTLQQPWPGISLRLTVHPDHCKFMPDHEVRIWNMGIRLEQLDQAIALAKSYGATRLILFGSAVTTPSQAQDLDLACDGVVGWKFYELGARLEEALRLPLDLVPLTPSTPFTRLIEKRGRVLF